MRKPPTNTALNPRYDWVLGGDPESIERQEAQGQRELVQSEVLPTEMDTAARAALETAGIIFGPVVDGDPIFQNVTLPTGWKKQRTNHSMWSDLVDDKGRKRASIFYKAAFYDRSAHLCVERRFRVERDYSREDAEGIASSKVLDVNTVIHITESKKLPIERTERYDIADSTRSDAEAWLSEHYPDWENPSVYW